MPSASKAPKADPMLEAAVNHFAARSHNAWRRRLLQTDPKQKGKPRMRLRGGVMVDVNQPWDKLDPKAQADNKRAARDAYMALKKFPSDREAAAEQVHIAWMKRNKGDASQPKALFKPYAKLPEVEKDKDRAHVDNMKKALAAVRKPAAKRPVKTAAGATVTINAKAWRKLQDAAKRLSAVTGRKVAPELLLNASIEVLVSVMVAVAAPSESKR